MCVFSVLSMLLKVSLTGALSNELELLEQQMNDMLVSRSPDKDDLFADLFTSVRFFLATTVSSFVVLGATKFHACVWCLTQALTNAGPNGSSRSGTGSSSDETRRRRPSLHRRSLVSLLLPLAKFTVCPSCA